MLESTERQRLDALKSYNILDSITESDYDNITYLASSICKTPIALISFVDKDRQWFKAKVGLRANQTPREWSFCAHAIEYQEEIFVVEDSRMDDRFKNNPLVTGDPNIVFYAGVPLITDKGYGLGTVCIIDTVARQITNEQKEALKILSRNVINLLELRKSNSELQEVKKQLEIKNGDLERFAAMVSHDIKSPLTSIQLCNDMLKDSEALPNKEKELIDVSNSAANRIKSLVDGILEYSKADDKSIYNQEIKLSEFFAELERSVITDKSLSFEFNCECDQIKFNRTKLHQIFLNLINNSVRYNDKEQIFITITSSEDLDFYYFQLTDNGCGIAEGDLKCIFNTFTSKIDRFGIEGTGFGLPTIKKIIEHAGGDITVDSQQGKWTRFYFSIKKNLL